MATKQHPSVHIVVYGPQGTGKSRFAASTAGAYRRGEIAGPTLVWLFDPRGKDAAYLGVNDDCSKVNAFGVPQKEIELRTGEESLGKDMRNHELVLPYTEVLHNDTLLLRVEYFHEEELEFAEGGLKDNAAQVNGWTVLPKLRKRINQLFREERDEWGTLVFDSTTSAELMIRSYHQYVQNPEAHGEAQKKWWGASTSEMEMVLAIRFASWRNNLVVICHTDKDKVQDDSGSKILRYNPKLPGRLSGDLSSYYPEVYHSSATGEGENIVYELATRPNVMYTSFSAFIKAPNPCENDYGALWVNW